MITEFGQVKIKILCIDNITACPLDVGLVTLNDGFEASIFVTLQCYLTKLAGVNLKPWL